MFLKRNGCARERGRLSATPKHAANPVLHVRSQEVAPSCVLHMQMRHYGIVVGLPSVSDADADADAERATSGIATSI